MTKPIGWVWQYTDGEFDDCIFDTKEDCTFFFGENKSAAAVAAGLDGKPVQVMLVPERLSESQIDGMFFAEIMSMPAGEKRDVTAELFRAIARKMENHILGESK